MTRPRTHAAIYRRAHPYVLIVHLGQILGGLAWTVSPDALEQSSIGASCPAWLAHTWAVWYALAGLLVVVGMGRLAARVESFGLHLSAGAWAVWAASVFVHRGFASGLMAASVFGGLSLAALTRAQTLGRPRP